jgi:hypothetical protein
MCDMGRYFCELIPKYAVVLEHVSQLKTRKEIKGYYEIVPELSTLLLRAAENRSGSGSKATPKQKLRRAKTTSESDLTHELKSLPRKFQSELSLDSATQADGSGATLDDVDNNDDDSEDGQ